jgi:excisionase family DNA binding protein
MVYFLGHHGRAWVASQMTDAPRLAYRIDEAAEAMRVTPATLYRWIATGKLKTVKIGGRRLVSAKVLNALLDKGSASL